MATNCEIMRTFVGMNIQFYRDIATTHGLSLTREYKTWSGIKQRCYNPNNSQYKYYGIRGIKMADEWLDDFVAFYNYITSLPFYGTEGYTLDRFDNDGDYAEGNLRWTDWSTQMKNKRAIQINTKVNTNSTSGYTGVCKKRDKWTSYVTLNRKRHWLGVYETAFDAYQARINFIKDYRND